MDEVGRDCWLSSDSLYRMSPPSPPLGPPAPPQLSPTRLVSLCIATHVGFSAMAFVFWFDVWFRLAV